jgi:hypothetical protein
MVMVQKEMEVKQDTSRLKDTVKKIYQLSSVIESTKDNKALNEKLQKVRDLQRIQAQRVAAKVEFDKKMIALQKKDFEQVQKKIAPVLKDIKERTSMMLKARGGSFPMPSAPPLDEQLSKQEKETIDKLKKEEKEVLELKEDVKKNIMKIITASMADVERKQKEISQLTESSEVAQITSTKVKFQIAESIVACQEKVMEESLRTLQTLFTKDAVREFETLTVERLNDCRKSSEGMQSKLIEEESESSKKKLEALKVAALLGTRGLLNHLDIQSQTGASETPTTKEDGGGGGVGERLQIGGVVGEELEMGGGKGSSVVPLGYDFSDIIGGTSTEQPIDFTSDYWQPAIGGGSVEWVPEGYGRYSRNLPSNIYGGGYLPPAGVGGGFNTFIPQGGVSGFLAAPGFSPRRRRKCM